MSEVHKNYYELDSLILYKNGTFYRNKIFRTRKKIFSELKGDWKIDNGILYLNIIMEKKRSTSEKWTEIQEKYRYRIKKRKLNPLSGYESYADRKLKLIGK